MDPNNPATVPPLLAAIDQPQAGTPRLIHPIGMLVGRADPRAAGVAMADAALAGFVIVPEDGSYPNTAGIPTRFRQGARVPVARARDYPDLAALIPDPIGPETRDLIPPRNEAFAVPERRGRRRAGSEG